MRSEDSGALPTQKSSRQLGVDMTEWEKELNEIDAPCWFQAKDAEGNIVTAYPPISCNRNCDSCGWNPKEQKRRIETGQFVNLNIRKIAETGEFVALPRGTRHLVFRRK